MTTKSPSGQKGEEIVENGGWLTDTRVKAAFKVHVSGLQPRTSNSHGQCIASQDSPKEAF